MNRRHSARERRCVAGGGLARAHSPWDTGRLVTLPRHHHWIMGLPQKTPELFRCAVWYPCCGLSTCCPGPDARAQQLSCPRKPPWPLAEGGTGTGNSHSSVKQGPEKPFGGVRCAPSTGTGLLRRNTESTPLSGAVGLPGLSSSLVHRVIEPRWTRLSACQLRIRYWDFLVLAHDRFMPPA